MSSRVQMSPLQEETEDRGLRDLLENYLRRSEELEERESKVLKQIELMQAAVTSLREWNQSRKASAASSDSGTSARPPRTERLDPREIEAETKLIEEETKRIRREVELKAEANRKLEEEIERNSRRSGASSRTEPKLLEVRYASPEREGIDFFDDRLRKLKEAERRLKAESDLKSAEARKKQKNLREKIEMLEQEMEMDKRLIGSLRKKTEKKP